MTSEGLAGRSGSQARGEEGPGQEGLEEEKVEDKALAEAAQELRGVALVVGMGVG